MAGGMGTRISSITNNKIPKAMLKIENKTIIEYHIECLKKAKIDEVIIVIGYLGSVIKNYFEDGKKWDMKISYFEENYKEPLGTAGSLYYLKENINDDFILIYGDIFLNIDFNKLISFHKKNNSFATLLTHPTSHPNDCDLVVTNKTNRVMSFLYKDEKRCNDYINLANTGVYCFSSEIFKYVQKPEKYALEKDIIGKAIKENKRVYSYKSVEYVRDIGTPERINEVREYCRENFHNKKIEKGNIAIFIELDKIINYFKIDDVYKLIKAINKSKYLCIVVTNNMLLYNTHKKIDTLLGKKGAYVDEFCNENDLILLERKHNIDFNKSIFVGKFEEIKNVYKVSNLLEIIYVMKMV